MNLSKFQFRLDSNLIWTLLVSFSVFSAFLAFSDAAMAGEAPTDAIGNALCNIVLALTGNIAKAIATIAIFSVGVSLFMGKMQWGTALAIAAGVVIVFAAPQIVDWISSNGEADDNCGTESIGDDDGTTTTTPAP